MTVNGLKRKLLNVVPPPQGSILGPLLFIIYMNYIFNASKLLFSIMYADDTSVQISGNDITYLVSSLNVELELLSRWFKATKLSLNAQNTFYLVFNRYCISSKEQRGHTVAKNQVEQQWPGEHRTYYPGQDTDKEHIHNTKMKEELWDNILEELWNNILKKLYVGNKCKYNQKSNGWSRWDT